MEEELRIDGYEERLVPISGGLGVGVAVRSDGLIAVRQKQLSNIQLYDARGELVTSVGREGEGPGEFESIMQIGWLADTLWAVDSDLRRISLFRPDGAFSRSVSMPTTVTPRSERDADYSFYFVYVDRLLSADTVVVGLNAGTNSPAPDSIENKTTVARIVADRAPSSVSLHRIIARVPIGDVQFEAAEGWFFTLPEAFRNTSVRAVSHDGGRVVFAMATLEGEHAGTFAVHALDGDGAPVFSRRYDFEGVQIPKSVSDSLVQSQHEAFDRAVAGALERGVERIPPLGDPPPPPRVYAPLADLLVDSEGRTWVEMIEHDGVEEYVVVARNGDEIARMTLAAQLKIVEARGDVIWVLEKDEFDVESVVRYRVLDWSPAQG